MHRCYNELFIISCYVLKGFFTVTNYSCGLPSARFCVDACNSFMEHQKYVHEMERLFPELHNNLQVEMQEKINWYIEAKYSSIFPQIHRQSTFITTFGLLEHYLLKLYKICRHDFLVTTEFNPKANIKKIFCYLENHISLDFSDIKAEISYLSTAYEIRNAIAHRGAILNEVEIEKLSQLNDQKVILSENNEVIFTNEFCAHIISLCRLIFIQLSMPIETRLKDVYGNWEVLNGEQQQLAWDKVQSRHNKPL